MVTPIERLSDAFNALPASIAVIDGDGLIGSVNAHWRQLARDQAADIDVCCEGINYLAVCDAADGPDREDGNNVAAGLRALLGGHINEFSYDYRWEVNEHECWFRLTARPITGGAVIMHVDITNLRLARETAAHAIGNDLLTDFATRHRFNMEFEEKVTRCKRLGQGLLMIMIKIDGLAAVNARFGYQAGDFLLREIAARMRAKAGSEDQLARLGGDEFAIVRVLQPSLQTNLTDQLLRVLSKPLLLERELYHPAINIGVAGMPMHATDAGGLMEFAEQATRIARSRGGGIHHLKLAHSSEYAV